MDVNLGNFFRDIKRSIKTSNFLIFTIIIFSAIMLFAPDRYIQLLYLEQLRNNYNWIFGLMFLVSIIILFLKLLYNVYYFVNSFLNKFRKF